MTQFNEQDHDDLEIPGHLEKPGRLRFQQRVQRQSRHDWGGRQDRTRQPGNSRRAQQAIRRMIEGTDDL